MKFFSFIQQGLRRMRGGAMITGVSALEKFAADLSGTGTGRTAPGDVEKSAYPRPNLLQMLPYKPKIIQTSKKKKKQIWKFLIFFPICFDLKKFFLLTGTYHPIPGGIFPPPPAVSHLLSLIPPPWCFQGPFVGVDSLIEKFKEFQFPNESLHFFKI